MNNMDDDNTSANDYDVESQSSTSVGASDSRKGSKDDGLRPYPVQMNMSKNKVDEFKRLYGINPILRPSEVYHQHPHLAYQRDRLELEALKEIGREAKVYDVGSGARRHAHYNIHCLCPYLQPGDATRLNKAIKNGNSVCTHKLEEWCNCSSEPDTFLFVHSAYYISGSDLLKAIKQSTFKEIYVVGHLFDEAFGSMAHDEADYRMDLRSQRPEIVMRVRGNVHEYRHAPLMWDGDEPHVGDVRLHVETLRKIGCTYLWKVREGGPYFPPTVRMDWRSAVVDHTQMGPIHVPGWDAVTRQALTANDILNVECDRVYGKGSWLMGETTQGRIYVPKGVIARCAREHPTRPRDPGLLLDMNHWMKKAFNSARLPEEEKLMSQTFAAAIAFNLNVRNEIDVNHTSESRFSSVWKIHAATVALTPLKVCRLSTIVFWTVFATLVSFVYLFWGPVEPLPVGLSLVGMTLFVSTIFFLTFCFKKWQSRRTTDNWSSVLYHEQEVSSVTGGISSVLSRFRFPAFKGLREPLLPPDGQQLIVGEDPKPPKHPGQVKEVITLQGVGFSTAVPTAPRTDQESEITAITHRILVPVTNVDRHALDKFYDIESTPEGRKLLDIQITGSHDMYTNWINQDKFTAAQKMKFMKEYDDKVKGDQAPKRGTLFNVFAKFEKMKVLTREGLEGLKTRLINGPPDAVKVAVGPWTARLYAAVRKVWNGRDSRILYASGMTPDEIGKVCDEFAEANGGWDNMVGIWDDCTAYDSTLENELLEIRSKLYPKVGFPESVMQWMASTASAGMSKHGCVFKLGKKTIWTGDEVELRRLFSGEMDTNLIGTIINGLAHLSGLPKVLCFLMLVCGDDNFILMPRSEDIPEIATALKEHLEALGLKPTQGISPNRGDWEFCSRLFWPAKDRQTGKIVTVLGPKPGRWLHRIGWSLASPHQNNFRQAMLSSMNDVAHIPILNAYVAMGVKLSHGMKARGKEYSELKHVTKCYDPVPEALKMLDERYGLTALHVQTICDSFKLCKKLPIVIESTWIESAAKRDEE
jgi:hypothetical protein